MLCGITEGKKAIGKLRNQETYTLPFWEARTAVELGTGWHFGPRNLKALGWRTKSALPSQ